MSNSTQQKPSSCLRHTVYLNIKRKYKKLISHIKKSTLSHVYIYCWLFRWLSAMAWKLKDSILPVRPVRNCRQEVSRGLRVERKAIFFFEI